MKRSPTPLIILVPVLACVMLVTLGCSASTPAPGPVASPTTGSLITPQPPATATPGAINAEALVNSKCPTCHTMQRVTSSKKTRDEWGQTVKRMVTLPAAEESAVLDYLAANYGK